MSDVPPSLARVSRDLLTHRADTRPTRRLRAALVAAALLALAACGSDPTSEAPLAPVESLSATPAAGSATVEPSPSGSAATSSHAGHDMVGVEVSVAGGEVQRPSDRVEVPLGSTVMMTVTSDEPDEGHVHGYDLTFAVGPGEPGTVQFPADIPGVFEVELHESGLPLVSLQVQ